MYTRGHFSVLRRRSRRENTSIHPVSHVVAYVPCTCIMYGELKYYINWKIIISHTAPLCKHSRRRRIHGDSCFRVVPSHPPSPGRRYKCVGSINVWSRKRERESFRKTIVLHAQPLPPPPPPRHKLFMWAVGFGNVKKKKLFPSCLSCGGGCLLFPTWSHNGRAASAASAKRVVHRNLSESYSIYFLFRSAITCTIPPELSRASFPFPSLPENL